MYLYVDYLPVTSSYTYVHIRVVKIPDAVDQKAGNRENYEKLKKV